jgi:hypothetical protein
MYETILCKVEKPRKGNPGTAKVAKEAWAISSAFEFLAFFAPPREDYGSGAFGADSKRRFNGT